MKLDMVGIIVKDIDEAIKFYEVLGLQVEERYGENYVELTNDSVRLSLNTVSMIEAVYGFKPSLEGQRIELAFLMESKKQVDELCEKLKKHNYKVLKDPWDAPWKQYYALVEDLDGNILSLFYNL